MQFAFLASFLVHAALLAALIVTLPSGEPLATPQVDAIPVEFITFADETDITVGDETAEELTENPSPVTVQGQEAEGPDPGASGLESERVATDPDAIVSPEESAAPEFAAAEPPAEADPTQPVEDTEIAAITPEPARVPETVTPRRRPTPPPQRTASNARPSESAFNPDRLSSLINRTDPTGGGRSTTQASIGNRTGRAQAELTANERDALRSQMQRCWSPPIGLALGDVEIVTVQVELSVEGDVNNLQVMPSSSYGVLYDAAVGSAQRAVLNCAPYTLPVAKYEVWKNVQVTFDPRDLF